MGKAKLGFVIGLILVSGVLATRCQYFPDSWEFWRGQGPPVRVGSFSWRASLPGIEVVLTPTDRAEAGREYDVHLYERGAWRASTAVEWDAGELNGGYTKRAEFVLDRPGDAEYRLRSSEELADIFSIRIREKTNS